ncbi:HaeIII family restriction endonuclease [Anaerococcus sp. WCA-380-WT-2B]|uniref:HaeIII family restriction endonuclease n=1 Tax=Anaerococcus porci TaxID=2652269 RepID=A0A6N7VXP7_9FIRM|nr:HaeIII family restriction endonuclease [Anaerococcus porci]MSS78814.1 HaeIII family restriction endonuclease [Anaerococcus porci]
MSKKSNNQGRAYEFACLITLHEEINKIRPAKVIENSSYISASNAFNTLTDEQKNTYLYSSLACVKTIFDLEPLILEDTNDVLELKIQTDSHGVEGDVRDILIIRKGVQWEIGLSVKHNHFAVKHSRLSKHLDFGKKWYGIECSNQYWEDVKPIFNRLDEEKVKGLYWCDMLDKDTEVYVPILKAFKNEIERQNTQKNQDMPQRIVEYLLGKFDFYKVIGIDNKFVTQVQSFNLRGTLNQNGEYTKRSIEIPITYLPTRIVNFDFKPNSTNTLELYLDGGWQFSFRIHNASSKVEPSLKFDVQIVGMPSTIITINCEWNIRQ